MNPVIFSVLIAAASVAYLLNAGMETHQMTQKYVKAKNIENDMSAIKMRQRIYEELYACNNTPSATANGMASMSDREFAATLSREYGSSERAAMQRVAFAIGKYYDRTGNIGATPTCDALAKNGNYSLSPKDVAFCKKMKTTTYAGIAINAKGDASYSAKDADTKDALKNLAQTSTELNYDAATGKMSSGNMRAANIGVAQGRFDNKKEKLLERMAHSDPDEALRLLKKLKGKMRPDRYAALYSRITRKIAAEIHYNDLGSAYYTMSATAKSGYIDAMATEADALASDIGFDSASRQMFADTSADMLALK